jgi:hypothetical protein
MSSFRIRCGQRFGLLTAVVLIAPMLLLPLAPTATPAHDYSGYQIPLNGCPYGQAKYAIFRTWDGPVALTAQFHSNNGLDETGHAHATCTDPYCDWMGYAFPKDKTWRVESARLSNPEYIQLYDAWCGSWDPADSSLAIESPEDVVPPISKPKAIQVKLFVLRDQGIANMGCGKFFNCPPPQSTPPPPDSP